MPSIVVDTNVVSFLFKGDTRARPYRRHLLGMEPVISFMTLAELRAWAVRRKWGAATRERLERHLQAYQVSHSDPTLCLLWAEVSERCRGKGHPIENADAWIAATALVLGVPLLTHDPADYAAVDGLTVITEAAS